MCDYSWQFTASSVCSTYECGEFVQSNPQILHIWLCYFNLLQSQNFRTYSSSDSRTIQFSRVVVVVCSNNKAYKLCKKRPGNWINLNTIFLLNNPGRQSLQLLLLLLQFISYLSSCILSFPPQQSLCNIDFLSLPPDFCWSYRRIVVVSLFLQT